MDDLPEDDWRRNNPRFQEEALQQNIRAADQGRHAGRREPPYHAGAARARLGPQAKGEDIVAIPGTKSPRRLEENAEAVEVRLSAENVAALDAALPSGGVAGTRYSANDMKLLSQ